MLRLSCYKSTSFTLFLEIPSLLVLSVLKAPFCRKMSHSSEEESDRSDSKLEDYSETCYKQLKDGKFEVRISVEVYRCPYCSQKKRKQQYGFEDLLKHASAIVEGSGLKGGVKKKGEHIGLLKYLESLGRSKTLEKISPEVLNHSQNSDDNELLVYPWVGIVANIPVTLEEGKHFGESDEKLRSEFTAKGFNPAKVTRLWNYRSHICFAVVEFGEGWQGFHSAMKFEKCFEASGNAKKKFFDARHLGSELYGWIGREDDYYSEKAFGEFLRKFRDLKTIKEIEAEEKNKSDMLLSSLSNVTEEENMRLKDIKVKFKETSILLNNLITEKDNLFQAYNEEKQKMQQNINIQLQDIAKEHQKLQVELEQREKDLQEREARTDNNERAALEQKKEYENLCKLTEDCKRENEELHKRNKDLEKQISDKQKTLKWEEEPYKFETLQTLGDKERRTNEELQDARRELINFLKKAKSSKWIGVKRVGELDVNPFHAACKRKFTGPEAEEKALELCSLWEDHLRDPDWFPIKIVSLEGGCVCKEIIDEEDEKLKRLKAEWGSEVQMAVATAFMEMIEYNNPTGKDDVWELWNHKAGRKATLPEGISCVLDSRAWT